MKLEDRERSSSVKEVEVSSSSPFMRRGGKKLLCYVHEYICKFLIF